MKKIIIVFILIFTIALNHGCIQRGLHNPEKEVTFTFEESDFEDDFDEFEKAQVVGDFNDWNDSPEAWHYYGFNDKGIPPDETKDDKIWTAKFIIPYGTWGYKFKINGSSKTDPNNDGDLIVSDDT
ncbi:hypothetical protein KAJ27_13900 [bacterium]|nr:hypothetical protein [bacterium]